MKAQKQAVPTLADFELMSTEQVAKLICVSAVTLNTWRCRGGGPPFVKLGRVVRYRTKDLLEWLQANLVAVTPTN